MKISKAACFSGLSIIFFVCLLSRAPAQEVSGYTVISAGELKKMQDSMTKILIIDTLTHSRYKQEHIPGAKHFEFPNENMDIWDKAKTDGKSRDDFVALVGEDKDKTVGFYCSDEK
jgi:rhodanese-related sulfurtransferase